MLLPLAVWAAFYFDRRKVLTAHGRSAPRAAITGTMRGLGPFHGPDQNRSLLELLAFLAILSFTGLAVSALAAERRRVESALRLWPATSWNRSVDQRTAALRESEETFAKAFHSSPIGLAISTVEEGRYLVVNDAFLRLLGFAREEVIGRDVLGTGDLPRSRGA